MDPLEKARAYARMKTIGVKIKVITSAAFDVDRLRLKKQKDEGFGRFLPVCLAMHFSYLGGIVG